MLFTISSKMKKVSDLTRSSLDLHSRRISQRRSVKSMYLKDIWLFEYFGYIDENFYSIDQSLPLAFIRRHLLIRICDEGTNLRLDLTVFPEIYPNLKNSISKQK